MEIVVRLKMLTREEGGRASPAVGSGGRYRPQLGVPGVIGTTGFFVNSVEEGDELVPGAAATVRGELLMPEALGDIACGTAVTLREGPRVVARGTVIEVYP